MKSNSNRKMPQDVRGRLGLFIGWILRKQCQFLISKGLSVSFAKKITIFVNIFILISLLFILFPMWIMFVILICGSLVIAGVDIDLPESSKNRYEYRGGTDGFGTYDNQFGHRVDAGSIEDEE